MLILITGATGFIGRHIVRGLIGAGHSVRALVRPTSGADGLAAIGAEVCAGSVSDAAFLAQQISGCDAVINAAGRLGKWGAAEDELRGANVGMVKHLLEAAQGTSVKQLIHFSTPGVVGMVGVAPECMPFRPAGAYERTKCEAEKLALAHDKHGTVRVSVLRPDFVYGPGDLHKLKMFKAISRRRFPLIGRGGSLLHPTYVQDVVDGTLLALGNEAAYGQVFNIAGPSPVTVRQLVHSIAAVLDVGVLRLPVHPMLLKPPALAAEMLFRAAGKEPPVTRQQIRFFTCDHASDISKAQMILDYQPRVGLDDGVARTIAWYRREGYL